MADFKTVDNATLRSAYWESALLEAAILLENAIATAPNAAAINFVGSAFDDTARTVTVTANIPVDFNRTPDGSILIAASPFVVTPFTGGGDIKSSTLPAAFLEIAQTIKNLELNSNLPQRLSLTYNAGRNFVAISATLPTTRTIISDGSLDILVVPYI